MGTMRQTVSNVNNTTLETAVECFSNFSLALVRCVLVGDVAIYSGTLGFFHLPSRVLVSRAGPECKRNTRMTG